MQTKLIVRVREFITIAIQLYSVSETTPLIPLIPSRCFHALVMAIGLGRILVNNTINDFIPFTSISASIFASQQHNEGKGAYPTNGYIREHNSMSEPVPRRIFGSILLKQNPVRSSYNNWVVDMWHTTLDATAPFRLPLIKVNQFSGNWLRSTYNPMAIPRVRLRLYEPSTFPATHALRLSISRRQSRPVSMKTHTELATKHIVLSMQIDRMVDEILTDSRINSTVKVLISTALK